MRFPGFSGARAGETVTVSGLLARIPIIGPALAPQVKWVEQWREDTFRVSATQKAMDRALADWLPGYRALRDAAAATRQQVDAALRRPFEARAASPGRC